MKQRYAVGIIYLLAVVSTLILRISGSEDIYSFVSIDSDAYFTLIAQILCFGVLPVTLYFLFCKKGEFAPINGLTSDFCFKKFTFRDLIRSLIIGVCMIYVATVVSYVWRVVLTNIGYVSASSATAYTSVGVLFLQLFLTAVLPPVFEEITHRGLLFAGYKDSGYKVVIVSALLFALMHQNIRQTGYTFFDGIVLALLVYYTGSIFPAMIVHSMNNAVSVLQEYGRYTGGSFAFMQEAANWLYGSLTGFVVNMCIFCVAMFVMLFLFARMRRDSVKAGRIPEPMFAKASAGALPLHKDVMLWAVLIIGVAVTVLSLVWGLMR